MDLALLEAFAQKIGDIGAASSKALWTALAALRKFRRIHVGQADDRVADFEGIAINRLTDAGDDIIGDSGRGQAT
jgi:hypothetical protein